MSSVPQLSIQAGAISGEAIALSVTWRVLNRSGDELRILDSWLPHGRFFGERRPFNPPLRLRLGESLEFDRAIRLSAEPGETVENAFLNLRLADGQDEWRVLARLRVQLAVDGGAKIDVESITAHPVGFAALTNSDRSG
jgi:hypothetical protein